MKKLSLILIYSSIFLIPFYFFRFSILGIRTNIFEMFVLLSLIITAVDLLREHRLNIGKSWATPVIFLLVALVSVAIAGDKKEALGIFKGWFLVPVVFAWLIAKTFNKRNIGYIAIPLYCSMLIISLWAILEKLGVVGTLFYQMGDASFNQYLQEGRAFGPFESPNCLAMYIVPVTLLSLPLLFESAFRRVENFSTSSKNINKIFIAVSFIFPILAIIFSGSRAGYITFILGLLIYLNYRFIDLQKTKMRRPFFVALFVSLFLVINIGYLFFTANYYKPESGSSDDIRVEIYKYSGELLKNHSMLGIGLGQFQSSVDELSENSPSFQQWGLPYALHPHNLFLALWLNLGLAGLAVFAILLVQMIKDLYFNDSKYKSYFIAAAFAIIIHGLFDTTYFKNDLSAIFWLIFAASLILKQDEKVAN